MMRSPSLGGHACRLPLSVFPLAESRGAKQGAGSRKRKASWHEGNGCRSSWNRRPRSPSNPSARMPREVTAMVTLLRKKAVVALVGVRGVVAVGTVVGCSNRRAMPAESHSRRCRWRTAVGPDPQRVHGRRQGWRRHGRGAEKGDYAGPRDERRGGATAPGRRSERFGRGLAAVTDGHPDRLPRTPGEGCVEVSARSGASPATWAAMLPRQPSNRCDEPDTASITYRVPNDGLDDLLDRIAALGTLISKQLSAQEVTEEYVDLTPRKRNLEREASRLLHFEQIAYPRPGSAVRAAGSPLAPGCACGK